MLGYEKGQVHVPGFILLFFLHMKMHQTKTLVFIFQVPLLVSLPCITPISFFFEKNHPQILGFVKDLFWVYWDNYVISAFEFP